MTLRVDVAVPGARGTASPARSRRRRLVRAPGALCDRSLLKVVSDVARVPSGVHDRDRLGVRVDPVDRPRCHPPEGGS